MDGTIHRMCCTGIGGGIDLDIGAAIGRTYWIIVRDTDPASEVDYPYLD